MFLKNLHSDLLFINFGTSAYILSRPNAFLFFSAESAHMTSASSMSGLMASFGHFLVVKVRASSNRHTPYTYPGGPIGSGYF